MLVRCPTCGTHARIVASDQLTNNTRMAYCQCKNINCSTTFSIVIEVHKVIRSPLQGSTPPTHQPELMGNPNQTDMFS